MPINHHEDLSGCSVKGCLLAFVGVVGLGLVIIIATIIAYYFP